MPAISIEMLNRRRDLKPASGGKNYARTDRIVSVATERAWAEAAAEYVPTVEEQIAVVFDDFRSFVRNLPPVALLAELGADEYIPF